MAHFASVDENDIVLEVIVIPNAQEKRGQEYCAEDLGLGGTWIQCSYNGSVRKNYPGVGYKFDRSRDAFIPPQPFASWTLNEQTCLWESPVAYPDESMAFDWNEESQNWTLRNQETE